MQMPAATVALLASVLAVAVHAQRTAPAREAAVPFSAGETLTYDVSWANLLTAGTATTRVVQKRPSFGATAWEISAEGQPLPLIQRLYPVYYKMDTLLDSASLLAQWTGLYMDENGRKRQTSMQFDRPGRKVQYEMTTEPKAKATLTAPAGIQDGLAMLYSLRARTFRNGERISVPVADDGSLYTVDAVVSGPAKVAAKIGTFDAFTLNLTILNEAGQPIGRNIAVSFGTDARRLPLRMEAELPVGKFVLSLKDAR